MCIVSAVAENEMRAQKKMCSDAEFFSTKGGNMFSRWSDIERMFGAMDLMRDRMNYLFPDLDRGVVVGPGWQVADTLPRTNLYDNGGNFEVWFEVPGISREDLHVKIQGNYLEISGTRKSDAPEGYKGHRVERGAKSFSRSFTLPSDVDAEKAEASLNNGILTLVLPKAEAAKPRQIAIN